jgi:hypothetical protein
VKSIKTHIIPRKPQFYKTNASKELDLKAICCFAATGFFLDTDTFWKDDKVLRPASNHQFDGKGSLVSSKPYFKWHYSPRKITFEKALDEFELLFDTIIREQTDNKNVILPLSGGIDSRTQAVALKDHPNVNAYSYKFDGGYPENQIGSKIAKALDFKFIKFTVQKGYLWPIIEELANMNQCYSDFTNPRQMAFVEKYEPMGEVFSLGHWGDVLFDGLGDVQWDSEQEIDWVLKKIVKKSGMEFASSLWTSWNLEGDFKSYFIERIKRLLATVAIEKTSAKLRAFKSMYWAPRWTSVNLGVFESVKPITLPYYDNRMCEFICTIPEEFLKDRRLQIAYIRRKSAKVSKIIWHEQKPFNLNNYYWNKTPYNIPYRIYSKLHRTLKKYMGRSHIARNWELQFLGKENEAALEKWLFESNLDALIDESVTKEMYELFKTKDSVYYSHPVNMLLTLAVFNKKFNISR